MIFISAQHDGSTVTYVDRKRYLWLLSILSPTFPAMSALAIAWTGNPLFAIAALVIYFVIVPVLDALIGEDTNNPPEAVVEQMADDPYYRRLLFVASGALWLNFIIVAIVLGMVAMPLWAVIVLTVATGVASGSGLTVSHELGHKQSSADQWAAKLVNALTGYAHFCLEHNRGHHLMVATPEDHASSRLGESIYRFAVREIPGVLRHGIALEARRLEKKGLPFWHWRNDLLQGYAVTLVVAVVIVIAFGWIALPFLLLHHAIGWLQLTQANYVEHYGLKRRRLDNGKREPCQPRHSWNTNHIMSNLMLFHLQRHSDHHANPQRPYQSLRNFEDLPHLPSGYPGTFVLAYIPPLWFSVMDRKVCDWANGDVGACNVRPGCEADYAERFGAWTRTA